MCRVCGRMVKCIFDSMPSRTMHRVPSRRAFCTYRQTTAISTRVLPVSRTMLLPLRGSSQSGSSLSLSRALSALSLGRTSTLVITNMSRQSAISNPASCLPSNMISMRSFSSSATLGAKRDTYDPSRRVQKRRHGFLARLRTASGRALIKRRRLKRRSTVSW